MRVKKAGSGCRILSYLAFQHPHISAEVWKKALRSGELLRHGRPATHDDILAAGDQLTHVVPNTVEPPVNPSLRVLAEDLSVMIFAKPAPLPVHPSGRFNRNSAVMILRAAFPELRLRPVHRLDANTTGVLLLAKNREAAHRLGQEFAAQQVSKVYLVRVCGLPRHDDFECSVPIGRTKRDAGTRDAGGPGARAAYTHFTVRHRDVQSKTSLLEVRPRSGRTNQIRIHLAELGLTIIGDNAYGERRDLGSGLSQAQTLCLHAWQLEFVHPGHGRTCQIEAPPPPWAHGSLP